MLGENGDKYSQMSHFSGFLHHFVLAKLATSSIRVKRVAQTYRKGSLLRDKYAASAGLDK